MIKKINFTFHSSNSKLKMMKIIALLPILFVSIQASGKLSILNYPTSLDFKGDDKFQASYLGDLLAASLGYYVNSESQWGGLYINNPFNVPKSAIVLLVDGVSEIHLSDKTKNYILIGNEPEDSLNTVASTIEAKNSPVFDIDLNQFPHDALSTLSGIFGEINLPKDYTKTNSPINPKLHSEDKLFLQQIGILNALTEKLSNTNKLPTLLIVRISLSPLSRAHGDNSPAITEALKTLSNTIDKVSDTLKKTNNDLMFLVATNKYDANSRIKRQAQTAADVKEEDLNLATDYNEDYPVIFNIILWFGVFFFFALLAVSYTIAAMDPGRDSIIYRMTSTRMKKDN